MNNITKIILSSVFALSVISPVIADDTVDTEIVTDAENTASATDQNVSVRMTCDEINSEIARLRAMDEPSSEESARLTDMQARHRKNCTARAANRAALNRSNHNVIKEKKDTDSIKTEAVYSPELYARQERVCVLLAEAMNSETDEENKQTLTDNHKKYCIDKQVAPEETLKLYEFLLKPNQDNASENVDGNIVESDDDIKAKTAANLAAGLCEDGVKPNKFGCCDGEKFKDLGNGQFGCCKTESDGEHCHNSLNKF
ncbi:MAG: hypothetical protein MJ187_00295 [Alphaproteobacteria bacterium]|nr:hypothetical protein [Alphaproteobacteria bacterium]